MDLISVIVPVYHVEAYLDRCVRSIVDQTYENLEIILVDDGSPDGCPAMCDAWAERDCRIQVIHKENGGLSDARNAGLEIATGAYIAFVDSDDWIDRRFLALLYKAMITQNAQVAECATDYVDEDGKLLRKRDAADVHAMDKLEALRRLILEDGVYQTVWNKLYRRDIINGIPFAVGKLNEDEFWTYRVLDRIQKLAIVRKSMYYYLQRGSSIMGAGYNLRRLDGLEARYLRMQYLQKYEELACLTRQSLIMDCMWHYQSASRSLQGSEKMQALNFIRKNTPCNWNGLSTQITAKLTHRLWIMLFRLAPDMTVWIRNRLGVGL